MGKAKAVPAHIERLFGPWTIQIADDVYSMIISAGAGDARAKGTLDTIKRAKTMRNPRAVEAQKKIDAVAKFVAAGLPMPSAVQNRKATGQPARKAGDAQKMQAAVEKQRKIIEQMKQANQANMKRLVERERAKSKAALEQQRQAAQRVNVRRTERDEYESKLADLQGQLQQRDIDANLRQALEAQAAEYEAKIAAMVVPAAPAIPPAVEPEPNVNIPSPEPGEEFGEQAAPGDVEFDPEG